jgi:hypothetical protein
MSRVSVIGVKVVSYFEGGMYSECFVHKFRSVFEQVPRARKELRNSNII